MKYLQLKTPTKPSYMYFKYRSLLLVASLLTVIPVFSIAETTTIFYENFEDDLLDDRIQISTVGSFLNPSGIKEIANLSGQKAFGYGISPCVSSCFNSYVTRFIITLNSPTYVSELSFKEIELYGNWGSLGHILIDGVDLGEDQCGYWQEFGRCPVNDHQPDQVYRIKTVPINKVVQTIELRVADITNQSEIFIDDITLTVRDFNIQQTPMSGPPETTFTQSGTRFTPNSTVTLHFRNHLGEPMSPEQLSTDATGAFTTDYVAPADKPVGTYTWWAVDDTTHEVSQRIGYVITGLSGTGTEIVAGETENPPQKSTNPFGTLERLGDWDSSRETFVIVHGWNRSDDKTPPPWVVNMGATIRNSDDSPAKGANVFFWNWQEKAKSKWPDSFNNEDCADWGLVPFDMTERSGYWLANALGDALPYQYDKDIHFIGHSLGSLVITYATKEAQKYFSSWHFSGHINHLVFLDSPCDFGKPGGDFLEDNKDDIFMENYMSAAGQSGGYGVTDMEISLIAKSGLWSPGDAHQYAHLWYRSSITGFKDATILGDTSVPSSVPHYGFYWWEESNRPDGFRQYSQKVTEPHWKLSPGTILSRPAGTVKDTAQYTGKIAKQTWDDLTKYAQSAGKQVGILSVNTFNSVSDVASAVKNAAGHAMQQNILCPVGVVPPCGTLQLSHASKTVVSMPITIPAEANVMAFGYEWLYATANGLFEVFINDNPIYHFVSDQKIGQGYEMTPWMNISTYAGQQVTLTLRLSNAMSNTEGAINIDDLIFAQISDAVVNFPWTMFLPALTGDK